MVQLFITFFADLAGLKPPHHMDGKSFKKQLLNKRNKIGFKYVFMEYWGEGNEKTVEKVCPWSYDENVMVSFLENIY